MARISIDDELHAEKGFKRLVRTLADEDKAIGMLYRFYRAAQDYWGAEKALMPEEEFRAEGLAPILEAGGLAIKKDNGIYACGGEERFAWYLQRCRASRAKLAAADEAARSEADRLRAELAAVRAELAALRNARSGDPGSSSRISETDVPDIRTEGSGDPGAESRTSETTAPDLHTVPVPVPATAIATVPVPVPASVPAPAARAIIPPGLRLVPKNGNGPGIGTGDRLAPPGIGCGIRSGAGDDPGYQRDPLIHGSLSRILAGILGVQSPPGALSAGDIL